MSNLDVQFNVGLLDSVEVRAMSWRFSMVYPRQAIGNVMLGLCSLESSP